MSNKLTCRCGKTFIDISFLRQHIMKSHPNSSIIAMCQKAVKHEDTNPLIELGVKDV